MTFNKSNVIVSGSRSSLNEYANYTTVFPKPVTVGDKIVLTQDMINKQNVKYIIKWNFDLDDETITVPEGCLIEFDGGSFSNGTLVGNETILVYNQEEEDVFKNVSLEGSFERSTSAIADKMDNTNGMAKIYLKKNKPLATQLTQPNTIYVIQYDFVLGEDITVPANCVLEFDGGSIRGDHTITGQNTILNNASAGCLHGLSLAGTFKGEVAHINWLHNTGDDISTNMQVLVNSYNKVIINKGTFYITDTVILRSNVTIEGEDREQSIIKASIDKNKQKTSKYVFFSTAEIEADLYGYDRKANLDNTDNEILYSNIRISNLTFMPNRNPNDYSSSDWGYLIMTPIYLVDAKDSQVDNCNFIDYQQEGLPSEYKNNASKAIVFYNCCSCKVLHCYSDKCTLFISIIGKNNEVGYNTVNNSIGTGIETVNSHYWYVHDNILNEIYWYADSMLGVNCKYAIIERNEIVGTNQTRNLGITLGHSGSEANHAKVNNNSIHFKKGLGIFVQATECAVIFNNKVIVDGQEEKDTWENWSTIDNGAIRISPHTNANLTFYNNYIYNGNFRGIILNGANNSIYFLYNNTIYGYCYGIYAGANTNVDCRLIVEKNHIDSNYCAFRELNKMSNVEIKNNYLHGNLQGGTLYSDNVIDYNNMTPYSDLAICIVVYHGEFTFENNRFINIPANIINKLVMVYTGTYSATINPFEIYGKVKGNIFPSDYDMSIIRFYGSPNDFFIKKPILLGKGDHTQLTPLNIEAGVTIYDIVLLKNVLWNGSAWVNVDGSAL